jgi:hypothetical protein
MWLNTRVSAPRRVILVAAICVYLFCPSNIELSSVIQVLLLYIWEYFDGAYLNISYKNTVTSSQIKYVRTFKVHLLTEAISHAISYNREVEAKQISGAVLLF